MPGYLVSKIRETPPRAKPSKRAYAETVYEAHVYLYMVIIAIKNHPINPKIMRPGEEFIQV